MEVGRPTDLTVELTLQIREEVLQGVPYIEIQKKLGIPAGTWDVWVYKDYRDFRKDLQSWKHEKMVKKAEKTIDTLIDAEDDRIKLDASKFILERLNKDNYSSRTENTGRDGKDLIPQPIYGGLSNKGHDSDQKDIPALQKN